MILTDWLGSLIYAISRGNEAEQKLKHIEEIVCGKKSSYFDDMTEDQKIAALFTETDCYKQVLNIALDRKKGFDLAGVPYEDRICYLSKDLWQEAKRNGIVSDGNKMIPMMLGMRLEREQ